MGEKAERRNYSPKDVQRNKKRRNGEKLCGGGVCFGIRNVGGMPGCEGRPESRQAVWGSSAPTQHLLCSHQLTTMTKATPQDLVVLWFTNSHAIPKRTW